MEDKREAVILVPGMMESAQNEQRDRLADGIIKATERAQVEQGGMAVIEGMEGLRIKIDYMEPDREDNTFDIYEAYWGDLIPRLSEEDLSVRVWRGTTLLFYWASPKVLSGIKRRKWLTISFIGTAIILLAWYYGTVALLFTAIGENPSLIAGREPMNPEVEAATAGLRERIAIFLGQVGACMGGWSVWVIVAFLSGFIPVDRVVNISDFARRYLKNETVGSGPTGLQDQLRNRVREVVTRVCNAAAYRRITIVAHSFASAIAVDLLADYCVPAGTRVRLITMGSPLELFTHRSNWIEDEIRQCASSKGLKEWIDFYSDGDWFCSKAPFHLLFDTLPPGLQQCEVHERASLSAKLTGKTHQRYFGQQDFVHTLIEV